MDHRGFLKSLSPDERSRLTAKSDRAGLLQFAGHGGAILVLGALIASQVPFWPLLLLPQGILIVFLFTALHETSHRTAFATPWLNRSVAFLCGLLIVLPPEWFRAFHFEHHRHTQDPARDPELASPKPRTRLQYLWYLSGLPVWRDHIATLVRNAAGRCRDDYVPDQAQRKIRREAQIMLAMYGIAAAGSIAMDSSVLLMVWLLPALLGQPFLRLYLLAEHAGCSNSSNMFENTRTILTNPLVRWIAWNMPYHVEHHAFAAVPFHRLPVFHAMIRPHIQVLTPGYKRFHAGYVRTLAD